MTSSRTWVWMWSATSAPNAGRVGECWDADRHVVTDAGGLNDGLVRMLGQQLSAEVGNHASDIVGQTAAAMAAPLREMDTHRGHS